MQGRQKLLLFLLGAGLLVESCALVALVAVQRWRAEGVSHVERGKQVAERFGCFTCHGLGGTKGIPNPGSEEKEVPAWVGGTVMMYADNEPEIREWILDGAPARVRKDSTYEKETRERRINMPAYRGKLSGEQLSNLVAYFKAVSWFDTPTNDLASRGREEAQELGCFNCHGPEGRGSVPNPGSLKGYIPGWDGNDYGEVVKNDTEFRQWVLNGISDRFAKNPAAKVFLNRAPVKMPAFKGVVEEEDLKALKAYIEWLRKGE